MSTLQAKEFYQFRDNEFRIETYPNDGAKKIAVHSKFGTSGFTSDDLDLSIEAANTSQDNIAQAGNLTLKGGDHGDPGGTGGDVLIKPGKSGGSAVRTGMAALCDEDEVPVVAVTKDKLAFFNGTLTEKPTVIGDWTNGTAGQNLIYALESLGLLTDNTAGPFAWPVYFFDEWDFSIYNDTVLDIPYPIPDNGAEYVRISEIGFYLSTQIQGTGDIEIKAGTSLGGTEVILAQNINSTTTSSKNVAGLDISTLGPAWPASTGYTLEMKPNDLVWPTITVPSGITGGKLRFYIKGVAYK